MACQYDASFSSSLQLAQNVGLKAVYFFDNSKTNYDTLSQEVAPTFLSSLSSSLQCQPSHLPLEASVRRSFTKAPVWTLSACYFYQGEG